MAQKLMDAVAFLSLDNSKFQRGAKQSEKRFATMGSTFKRVGAGIAGYMGGAQIMSAVNSWSQLGDAIEEASQRTGIGVAQLSKLSYVAGLSGSSLEGVELAIRNMQRNMTNAPTDKFAQSMSYLHLSLQRLRASSPENAFNTILYQLSRVEDENIRATIAMNIFGKSGAQILPLLENGYAGLVEQMKQAADAGVVFTPEQAESAAKFQDALTQISTVWKMFIGDVLGSSGALDGIVNTLNNVSVLLKEGKEALTGTNQPGDVSMSDVAYNEMLGLLGGDPNATYNAYGSSEGTLQNAKARNERAKSRAIQENLMSAGVKSTVEGRQAVAANTQNTNYIVANGNFVAGPDMKRAVNRNKAARASI